MALHEVAFFFELFQTLIARQKFARVGKVLLHQFLHLLFDLLEVFRSERRRAVEVVEESALGGGTVAKLGLGEKFEHCRRQQVRRRMAEDFERLGIFLGQDAEVGVFLERTGEVDEIAVGLGDQRGIGQARADGLRDIERGRAFGNVFGAPVGELHMNAVCHRNKPEVG